MKTEKFIKDWEKARRSGKIVYLLKFSMASLIGILIADLFVYIFFQFSQFNLIMSLVIFITTSVSLYFKWDSNEERYEKLK